MKNIEKIENLIELLSTKDSVDLTINNFVLEKSLFLEQQIDVLITIALNPPNEKPKSIGVNTSESLSFNQKLNLLMDLGYIEKKDHKRFRIFMTVRNKFCHVLECNSFKKLENINQQIIKELVNFTGEKHYNSSISEELCKVAFERLFESLKLVCKIIAIQTYWAQRKSNIGAEIFEYMISAEKIGNIDFEEILKIFTKDDWNEAQTKLHEILKKN